MTSEQDEREADTPALPPRLPILISVGALVLVIVHLVWPDLRIDGVTLALLAVAALPWLAPIFKSIELPGGWKFEYQEVQRQVREVARRVDEVERLVFSGDTSPDLERRLTAAVRSFAEFLRGIHGSLDVEPPSVHLQAGLENAYFDTGAQQIGLDPKFARDDYSVLREYAHHALVHGADPPLDQSEFANVESGLADYLVASHTGDPELGVALAGILRAQGFDKPYIRNLNNDRHFDTLGSEGVVTPQDAGEVWGGAFWQLRGILSPSEADRALVAAWFATDWAGSAGDAPFVKALLEAVDSPTGDDVRAVFEDRGLPLG